MSRDIPHVPRAHRFLKRALGVVLLLVGLLALLTPFTPGSWFILVGAGLLGWDLRPGERLRSWWKRRTLKSTHP